MNKQEAIKLVIAAAQHGVTVAKYDESVNTCWAVVRIGRHDVANIERAIELVKRFELEGEDSDD